MPERRVESFAAGRWAGVIGIGALLVVLGGEAGARQDGARVPVAPTQGTYRSDRLGIEYRLEPYEGHYGAKLTRPPLPGSPFLAVRLSNGQQGYFEVGDMIVALDDLVIDGPADVENHIQLTTIRFINVQTGQLDAATAMFPPDLGAGGGGGGGGGPGESRIVRAVVVVDTNTGLMGLDRDRDNILGVLDYLERDGRCRTTVLEGNNATAGRVINTLRAMGNASGDTVFVYYAGHGATDPARGHFLAFDDGSILPRSVLRDELRRLTPRLSLTISDCCSDVVPMPQFPTAPMADPLPLIRSLFLRTRGVVDLNGSTYDPARRVGESCWGDVDGGLFTTALSRTIQFSDFEMLDRNRDGLVTWAECFPEIVLATDSSYGEFRQRRLGGQAAIDPDTSMKLRRQTSQRPQAFALDGRPGG